MDIDRHIPANLGDPHVNTSVANANGLVDPNVRIVRNMDWDATPFGIVMRYYVTVNFSYFINCGNVRHLVYTGLTIYR